MVEVTCRTIQGRFLLTPTPQLREIVVGILARAARRYPLEVCGLVFLSNHFHLLLVVPDARRLSQFMCFVSSNLAREAGRLVRWRDRFWARRYQAIVVSEEEGAQVARLKYLLSHGCKEGLVSRPEDWPGAHGIHSLRTGEPLAGYWFDRTRESLAGSRLEARDRLRFATAESLTLLPLPCWRQLSEEEVRRRVAELLQEVEAEAVIARQGKPPLGRQAVVRQDPHGAPPLPKRAPAPDFHTVTRAARERLRQAYASFVRAFRDAVARIRAGDASARFPPGSFPPAGPFVEAAHPT